MKALQRGRVDAPVLLAVTVLVTLFTVLPMMVSVTAGLTNNFSRGIASGLTLRWVQEVWALYGPTAWRSVALALACVALQLFFAGRIALMCVLDPQSTSFQRSEAWRLTHQGKALAWRQDWVPYTQLPENLKRAVIVSEDDMFAQHRGVQWDAIEKAWQRNARHANACAAYLADRLAEIGIIPAFPPQANGVFIRLTETQAEALRQQGWVFYISDCHGAARFMCGWDSRREWIDRLVGISRG